MPAYLYNLNKTLSTLQFQSLSVAADNPKHLQGGTQDNGTFETTGSAVVWPQIIYGDGGQSGFSVTNSSRRFNSFTSNFHDVNFQNGDPVKWVIASGPIAASGEGAQFYAPIIADPNPAAAGTIFQGSLSVWRTQDWAGNQAFLEANCPEFITVGRQSGVWRLRCHRTSWRNEADSVRGRLPWNDSFRWRTWRRSGARVPDTATLWAATTTGRVFISKNADTTNTSVTYTRLDSLAANSPGRFISGIVVDPADSNHAWISYSSYSSLDPTTPGHVFSVTFDPGAAERDLDKSRRLGNGSVPRFPGDGHRV